MRQKIYQWALPICCILSALIFLFIQVYSANRAADTLPRAIKIEASGAQNVRMDILERLRENDNNVLVVSGEVHETTMVTDSNKSMFAEGDVVYTNSEYGVMQPLDFICGEWYSSLEASAVISDDLAVKLFYTTQAKGRTFMIGDKQVTVSGVYRSPKGLVADFSSSGRPVIYAPYTVAENFENLAVSYVCVSGAETASASQLIYSLARREGIALSNRITDDYREAARFLRQFPWLSLELCGFILAFTMLIFGNRALRVKEKAKRVTAVGCLVGGAMLLFTLVSIPLFWPSSFLPPDAIFDMTHYYAVILENVRVHSEAGMGIGVWGYSSLSILINALLMIGVGVFFWMGVHRIRRLLVLGWIENQ